MTTQQYIHSLMEGYEFEIAGTTFRLVPSSSRRLEAVKTVLTDDGERALERDTVTLPDGRVALEEDTVLVHTSGAYSPARCERGGAVFRALRSECEGGTLDVGIDEDSGEWYDSDELVAVDGYSYRSGVTISDYYNNAFLPDGETHTYLESCDDYFPNDEVGICDECGTLYRIEDSSNDCCEDCSRCEPHDVDNDGYQAVARWNQGPDCTHFVGQSGWLTGFEVEKNSVGSADSLDDNVKASPLFAGWVTDGSCGIEGVTHAYDLLDPESCEQFRRDVAGSEDQLNAPCDEKSRGLYTCGGHMSFSRKGISNDELFMRIRRYMGLFFAMFRYRLKGDYTDRNRQVELRNNTKYSPLFLKTHVVEMRLPSRVVNADCLLRRAELAALLCRAIDEDMTYCEFLRSAKPILEASYSDPAKVKTVLTLARHFKKWLVNGTSHPTIERWCGDGGVSN
jgi:hypothetical protein